MRPRPLPDEVIEQIIELYQNRVIDREVAARSDVEDDGSAHPRQD